MASFASLSFLIGIGLVLPAAASAAANGPYNFSNSAIADHAETYANGALGGQCLVFVENMIKAAGGPQLAFGNDTNTYQSQWAQHASPVGSLAEAQRGDIVQWGGGAGGNPHTAIITVGGTTPQAIQVIDSNFGYNQQVSRGSLSSRTAAGSVYRIWRVGVGITTGPLPDGSLIRTPDGSIYRIVGAAPLHISSCAYTNGCAGVVNVPNLDGYLNVPRDGALLRNADNGNIYEVVGGAPLHLGSCAYANCGAAVNVDSYPINALDHLNAVPSNGSLIRNGDNGNIYEVVGGAPLHLGSCAYANCGAAVNVDSYPINALDHLNAVPSNGSLIRNGDNGNIYEVAGGAALPVTNCAAIGGCTAELTLDGYALSSNDHLNAWPTDGTVLVGEPSGSTWIITAGKKNPATVTAGAVAVNDATVAAIPNA
jgi:hypothetical protein